MNIVNMHSLINPAFHGFANHYLYFREPLDTFGHESQKIYGEPRFRSKTLPCPTLHREHRVANDALNVTIGSSGSLR